MESKIIFSETQLLRQNSFIYVVYFAGLVLILSSAHYFSNNGFNSTFFVVLVVILFINILVITAKLSFIVTEDELRICYFPFTFSKVIIIKKEEIRNISIQIYDPISEFGGWGFRIASKKKAYSTRGNNAIVIEKTNGKLIYVGTQKANEFEKVIDIFFKRS